MKTKEKTSECQVPQVVFRTSSERPGFYRFHFGYFTPAGGTFAEERELRFLEFLGSIGVPEELVFNFEKRLGASEFAVSLFGYLSQERFNEFVRDFSGFCGTIQLYPGMLVFTFSKEENEG